MPNSTFYNLEEKRRKEIIEISIHEFIKNDYYNASLNKIIISLGIAKGCFYRYFENKQDLYTYLVDYCVDKKSKQVLDVIDMSKKDIFEAIQDTINAHINFHSDNSIYAQFLLKAFIDNNISLEKFIFINRDNEILLSLIEKAQENGNISKSFDSIFVFNSINQLTQGVIPYIEKLYDTNKRPEDIISFNREKITSYFEQVQNLIKMGFCVKE